MTSSLEDLEQQLVQLRAQLREARRARDTAAVAHIRGELRKVEVAWEHALDVEVAVDAAPGEQQIALRTLTPPGTRGTVPPSRSAPREKRSTQAAVPIREQVHQALTLLGAPASPKLISSAYEAFFGKPLVATKLASLRRDEERSFTAQGYARPYYICAALTHDRLTPTRGLLAVSVWPLPRRIMGPLSPRMDFLTHAIGTAEQIQRLNAAGHPPSDAAWQLLRRFALNIPGAHEDDALDPARVISAARNEIVVHQESDDTARDSAADRARTQLNEIQQFFGAAPMHNALRDTGGASN